MPFLLLFFVLICTPLQAQTISVQQTNIEFIPLENEYVKLLSITHLAADHDEFGGLSALAKDGGSILALSDHGQILTFDPAFRNFTISNLLKKDGTALEEKEERDSESLALTSDQKVYIAFERDHRVRQYSRQGALIEDGLNQPKKLGEMRDNGGLEAMEALLDNRLIALGQSSMKKKHVALWRQMFDGTWEKGYLPVSDGYVPTGLARIPGSDQMILLERSFSLIDGVGARLSFLDGQTGKRGVLLLTFDKEVTPIDNFEGVIVTEDPGSDRQIITLIADDNFNPLQRTLLMKLELKKGAP